MIRSGLVDRLALRCASRHKLRRCRQGIERRDDAFRRFDDFTGSMAQILAIARRQDLYAVARSHEVGMTTSGWRCMNASQRHHIAQPSFPHVQIPESSLCKIT